MYVKITSIITFNKLTFVDKHSDDITHLYQFVSSSTNNYIELLNHYKANFATVLTPSSEIKKTEELGEGDSLCFNMSLSISIIGAFGVVFKGKLIKEGTITDVAIKSLKG